MPQIQQEPPAKGFIKIVALPPKPSVFRQLLSLFLHPSFGLVCSQIHRIWCPAFFSMFFLFATGAFFKGIADYRRYSADANEIVDTIAPDIAPLTFKDGKLIWSDTLVTPYTNVISSWRIDVSDDPLKAEDLQEISARHGIIITPEYARVWNRTDIVGDRKSFYQQDFLKKKHIESFEQSLCHEGRSAFEASELMRMTRLLCILFLPFMMIFEFMHFAWAVIFCMIVFGISTMLFRRDLSRSMGDLCITGINCALPPTLVSLVWYAAAPPSWSFDTIFFVAFILYLFYVYWDTRAFIGEKPQPPQN